MLILRFKADDLATLRFACSPLQETVISLWVWRYPTRYAMHQPLVKSSSHNLDSIDWPLLQSLIGPGGFLPDFLTPHPAVPKPEFPEELARLRATEAEVVLNGLVTASCGQPLPARLQKAHDDPLGLLEEIAEALLAYWELILAPRWPRLRSILEADILYHAKRLAHDGAQGLFENFDPRLTWRNGTLAINEPGLALDVDVSGRGFVMTPSVFCNRPVTLVDCSLPPRVWYPARGRNTTWHTDTATSSRALADLIGRTRSQLLEILEEPISTSELAHRCNLSQGAVSQHLGILFRAGLVDRSRQGHTVLYCRNSSGDRLLI